MSQPMLSDIQKWLMTAITSPGGLQNGLHLARNRFCLNEDEIIAQSGGAIPLTRLGIYAQGYWLRLLECLRADFPALRYVMGEELFDFFAKAYIWNHPSTSTTLFDLGAGFADFLQKTQSSRGADPEKLELTLALPLDVAKLERTCTEAIRAKGLEGKSMSVNLEPLAFLSRYDLKIQVAPCLRLINLSFPLINFLEAIERGEENPALPEPKPCHIAITRIRYRVYMSEIQSWQYYFLKSAEAYSSPYDCATKCSQESDKPLDDILSQLVLWLPLALNSGFLTIDD
ncbi:putative DNA-binding domain-containing protein [Nostoc sp. UHCC 0702]|nr:putative DNA-binding domain-containing protein [Nostoc sp. UHCC 0702]